MGFKIWRQDTSGWSLAFDSVYNTKEAADARIQELNAAYAEKIHFGELAFYLYRDDIKIAKDGSIVDSVLKRRTSKGKRKGKRRKNKARQPRPNVVRLAKNLPEPPPFTPEIKEEILKEAREFQKEMDKKIRKIVSITPEDLKVIVK